MGNKQPKQFVHNSDSVDGCYTHKGNDFSQANVLSCSNSSVRSTSSSYHTAYSCSLSASSRNFLIYRRRLKLTKSTISYDSNRTFLPAPQLESCFLPEFSVIGSTNQDNYKVLELVGRGSFSKVYKAEQINTEKNFVLKVLSKAKVVEENFVSQVKKEVNIQKLIGSHPFIVNLSLSWQTKTELFIVTEFIEGGEFFVLLTTYGILPFALAQLYIAQISLALEFLHHLGVIYRDLKAENILLTGDGDVKIIDFGFSKWLSHKETTRTICGTPEYMAPEILASKPYGHAVDWWSLGVLSCVMLTGQYPEPARSVEEAGRQPGSLPEDVQLDVPSRDLLLRLLEIDPAKRLKSVRALSTIAFYKGYDIYKVKEKKVSPKALLLESFPNGPPKKIKTILELEDFDDF